MTERSDTYWSEEEVQRRLGAVREELLEFLRERTRLEWFEQKVRWRLSRQFIWPASPESSHYTLEKAVAGNVSVEAFRKHLEKRKRSITEAIERYNHAVTRKLEVELGCERSDFDDAQMEELRRRRITFQGVRDELRRRARVLGPDSDPSLIPETLSLRLAILTEEVRVSIFHDVAALVADEHADARGGMTPVDREILAMETELRLRCLDRYHVARLLAVNYSEGRRFLALDRLLEDYRELRTSRAAGEPDPVARARAAILRDVLQRSIAFLEEIFPSSTGTHDREMRLLRTSDVDGDARSSGEGDARSSGEGDARSSGEGDSPG